MERRVELFAAIRFDWQRYQMPVRALARKYDVHRRTVRQAIASPVPPDRKVPERAAPVREAVWRPATSVDSDHTRITGHRRNPDGDEVPEVRRRL